MLIGYARVSTVDQNPELQLDALSAAGCGKVFVEKASGAKVGRVELIAALAYMRPGDTLVVWKLDRLARSIKQLITTVEDLKARGIGFRSLTEAIDTTSAAGELFFHIFGALAQFERSIIRERTNAGLAAASREAARAGASNASRPTISAPLSRCSATRRFPSGRRRSGSAFRCLPFTVTRPVCEVELAAATPRPENRASIVRSVGKAGHGASSFAEARSLVGPSQPAH